MEVETQTLKDTAEQALIGLIQSVADAAAFLKGEIPVAVKELLTYYSVYYGLCVALGLAWIAAVVWVARWRIRKGCDFMGTPIDVPLALGAMLSVSGIPILLSQTVPELLKVTLAPRIWLIEYAASLVK